MKRISVLIVILTAFMLVSCGGDNCMNPVEAPVIDDVSYVEPFTAYVVYTWYPNGEYHINWDRECGGEGWTMIPERLQPCAGVTFYAYRDGDKISICSDSPPCDSITQGQINAMYSWAVGTNDTPSD
jgi:hypothetical protein